MLGPRISFCNLPANFTGEIYMRTWRLQRDKKFRGLITESKRPKQLSVVILSFLNLRTFLLRMLHNSHLAVSLDSMGFEVVVNIFGFLIMIKDPFVKYLFT